MNENLKEAEHDLQPEAGKNGFFYYKSNLVYSQKQGEVEYDGNAVAAQQEKKAVSLFSAFTADIIKEEIIFIR